jgi:serine/threonine protein kinase
VTDASISVGSVLAGKFRILRVLGEGGMGAVYEIEHELTKHRRALKLLHPEMAQVSSVVERFLREASAAGRVGNPHIVETFDAGVLDTGEPYLVMELLRGEPLSYRIARGPMFLPDVIDIMGQACVGIAAAHAAGIVHRDLKPDNLFIVDVDGRPFVKILDFGISKFDPSTTGSMALTQEGAALGTPYYMAPEQIRGQANLDARADVYALGVILYECLAGKRPFEAEVLTQLAILIHTGKPEPLSALRPDLPAGLADLVHYAMTSDPERRMQTASELCARLERYGTVSFQTHAGPIPSLPPPSVAPMRPLATSGIGVSMHATQPPKRRLSALAVALVALGLASVLVFLALRSGGEATAEHGPGSASPAATAPELGRGIAPEPSFEAPTPAAAPAPVVSVAPMPEPAVAPPSTASVAASARPLLGSSAAVKPKKPTRAESRGLAEDNPFK